VKRIIFLASGNGGSLKSIYYAIQRLHWDAEVDFVIADRARGALEFARASGIRSTICSYQYNEDNELYALLLGEHADLVITNVHKIVTKRILDLLPGKFLNLHYSLLPAFGGLIGMQTLVEAAKQNVRWVGATSHIVDELVDHGQILGQCIVRVDWHNDSLSVLHNVVFRGACIVLMQSVLSLLEFTGSKNYFAYTAFEKRVLFNPL